MQYESESQGFFDFFTSMGPLGRLLFALGLFFIGWRGPGIMLGISFPDEPITAEIMGILMWFELAGYVAFLLLGLPALVRLILNNIREQVRPEELFVALLATMVVVGFPFILYASHLSG